MTRKEPRWLCLELGAELSSDQPTVEIIAYNEKVVSVKTLP